MINWLFRRCSIVVGREADPVLLSGSQTINEIAEKVSRWSTTNSIQRIVIGVIPIVYFEYLRKLRCKRNDLYDYIALLLKCLNSIVSILVRTLIVRVGFHGRSFGLVGSAVGSLVGASEGSEIGSLVVGYSERVDIV